MLAFFILALPVAAAACGGGNGGRQEDVGDGLAGTRDSFEDDSRLRVATTVAPITSIVLNVGGDRVVLHGLIPDGVDSHTYEPRPSDAVVLSRADILIMNGANLEGTTEAIARENMKDPSKIFRLADSTLSGDDE
jgi:manganese/iron transport system substrate-binding protein